MSMPFNMIYQAAHDREDEIQKESGCAQTQARQAGRLPGMLGAIFSKSRRRRTYKKISVSEQAAK